MREALEALASGRALSREEARLVMGRIMDGEATPSQIGALLMALRVRGETVPEIIGFAEAMRARATRVEVRRRPVLDTCGTGGDGSGSLNLSTLAGLVAAGAGVTVAKHGNRSVSSRSGSADVLEALGVPIPQSAADAADQLNRVGFALLFAPLLHSSMRYATPARRELGIRTVFNVLGPLTNPAGAEYQVLGVFDAAWVEPIARVLAELGTAHAMVVHGTGLDEVSLAGPTAYAEVRNGSVRRGTFMPGDFGLDAVPLQVVRGGDPSYNAERARTLLQGGPDPALPYVLANAGVALYVVGQAASPREGVEMARRVVADGAAWAVVERLRAWSPAVAQADA
jgi:anthranilate phosphoribosyltransferase